jgi:hypothetical protein
MLNTLLSLLLCGVLSAPKAEERNVDAVEIFYCDFTEAGNWDINYDGWPDKWKRQQGPHLPHYVKVAMEDDETAIAGRCLSVKLNGGGAEVNSPAVAISDKFSYVAEAQLRGEKLESSRARLRIDFCDEQRRVLESAVSPWFSNTEGWQKINIGPVDVTHPDVRLSIITLVVEQGKDIDLHGKFSVCDIWLARLPRMSVKTNSPFNVYDDPKKVMVTCELSGIREQDPDIRFRLLDASSQELDDNTVQLQGKLITEKLSKASDIINIDRNVQRPAGYAGSTNWPPPIKDYGYYRIEVSMHTARKTLERQEISIAVVPPIQTASRGEFGWSLAGDEIPLDFEQLQMLLPRTGVSWVKLPVWYGITETERGDQLVHFTEQLAAKDIDVVGVLDRPPADLDFGKEIPLDASIADLLSNVDSSVWLPSLDEVLTRLSLRVRWWQLGIDNDTSYAHFPNCEKEIRQLRDKLFRFGQDVSLGIGWPWLEMPPSLGRPTWDFEQMSVEPQLTGTELASYLRLPAREGITRWTSVQPLPREDYDLETRTQDLVQQMISAKINGAGAIFAANPFDDENGLMTEVGSPGDLLLPWRTTASLLSGTVFLGSIPLPGGSENRLFQSPDGTVVMVLWNQVPRQEVMYLGDHVKIVDVFGRAETPVLQDRRHLVEVTQLPKFITGMNGSVARMGMGAKLANTDIPSVFELAHANSIEIENTFQQGIGGTIKIVGPEGWQMVPDKIDFKLAIGEKVKRPFQIFLPFDATCGSTPLRIDFDVIAERPYRFSVYRDVNVGDKEIELEVNTRLQEDGTLIVEQRMINRGDTPVDFKCLLNASSVGRRQQRMQVFQLTNSWDTKTYNYVDGEELLGEELYLKVEEQGGQRRVLNYRFMVDQ